MRSGGFEMMVLKRYDRSDEILLLTLLSLITSLFMTSSPLKAEDDATSSSYLIFDPAESAQAPYLYVPGVDATSSAPLREQDGQDAAASAARKRDEAGFKMTKISARNLSVVPGSRLRLQLETDPADISCSWTKFDRNLCQGKVCEFSTDDWHYGPHKVFAFCHNRQIAYKVQYSINIVYGFKDEVKVLVPPLINVTRQPRPMLYEDAYMKLLGGKAYAHYDTTVVPLERISHQMQWKELLSTDVSGGVLFGRGDRFQHILFPSSRLATRTDKEGVAVLELMYGKVRCRNIEAVKGEWRMVLSDWLEITPDAEADFFVERTRRGSSIRLTVMRGRVEVKVRHAKPLEQEGPRSKDARSLAEILMEKHGIYQIQDEREERMVVPAGMKATLAKPPARHHRALQMAAFEDIAPLMELTTPEYYFEDPSRAASAAVQQRFIDIDQIEDFHRRLGLIPQGASGKTAVDELRKMIRMQLDKRDFMAVLELAQPYLKEPPDLNDGEILFAVAEAFRALKKYSKANLYYGRVLKAAPQHAGAHIGMMLQELEMGRYHETLLWAQRLALIDDKYLQVSRYYGGLAHFKLGRNLPTKFNMRDAVWLDHDPVITRAAQEFERYFEKNDTSSFKLRQEAVSNSNVFNAADAQVDGSEIRQPGGNGFHTSFELKRFIFKNPFNTISFVAQGELDLYPLPSFGQFALEAGLDFSLVAPKRIFLTSIGLRPFVATQRDSSGGVDGFGFMAQLHEEETENQRQLTVKVAKFLDASYPQQMLLDPFTGRFRAVEAVGATTYQAAFESKIPLTENDVVTPGIGVGRTAYTVDASRFESFNRIEVRCSYLHQFNREWESQTNLGIGRMDFYSAADGRKDALATLRQSAGYALNSLTKSYAFFEYQTNSSSRRDYGFNHKIVGVGAEISY
jgi:tetratricopeptide (TPR) repeat protein